MAHLNEWQKFQEHLLMHMESQEAEQAAVLAAYVVLEEREACAKLAAEFDAINDDGYPVRSEGTVAGAELIAQAIRARTANT
jgi:plasmid stability protein